jgi:flagellar M-ring protein FliF
MPRGDQDVNEYLLQLLTQMKTAWQGFSARQKLVVVAVPALLLAGLLTLGLWSGRSQYKTLYSNLNQKDAGAILGKLKEGGIPYRMDGNGDSISVPEEKLYETRLGLAAQGLPSGGGVGFEVFDKTSFGVTDFTQQVNYQRALEGELARTIMSLGEVRQARVHLVMPKPELYSAKEKDATSSVVIDLNPNATLRPDQIRGIIHLVASSVEGLKPENVTLLDSSGNILSELVRDDLEMEKDGTKASTAGKLMKLTDSQIEIQHKFEKELERRVSGMLDRVLGPNRAAVRVSAELNFDQSEEDRETYEPVVNNQGIVRSSQRKTESFTGQGSLPGGVPGTDSNIPGYQSYSAAGNSNYTKNEETANYEINKRVAHVVEAPGQVKRMSVAVMVDSLQPQQVDSIRSAVVAAAGLDLSRGDQVAVENISFDTTARKAEEARDIQFQKQQLWTMILKGGFVLLLVLFLLLFLRSILKPRVVRVQERLIREITRVAEEEPLPGEEAAIPLEQVGRPSEQALEEQRKAQIRQQVLKLAREKPKAIAMLIRRWLSEEKG